MPNARLVPMFLCVLALLSGSVAADVSVRVNVSCEDCADGSAYVALVAADDVTRRPADEAVAMAGSAELVVPAGPYLLVAVAGGHAMAFEPHAIAGPGVQQLNVHLQKNSVLTGTVVDAEGRPVANAVVARAGLDAPSAISELSPAGMSALRENGSTRTDEGGRWSLPSPSLTKIPLTVHAPGYATAWISLEKRASTDTALPPVALEKACRLTVEMDRMDEEMLVIPRSRASSPFPAEWLDRSRARTATAPVLEWPSLAAGVYDLYAVNTNPLKFQKPEKLTTVHLESAGQQARVKVSLPQPRPAKTAYVRLLLPRIADTASMKAWAETSVPAEIAFTEEDAVGGRVVYLDTAAAPERTYLTTSHQIFLPRSGSRAGALGVQMLPRGTLSFRLVAPAGTKLPTAVRGAFSACAKDEPARPMSFAVSNNGAVEMAVPAACRVAVIETGDFAPVAASFAVKPMEKRALRDFRLSRSARAEVHVVRQPGGARAEGMMVRARVKRGGTFIALPPVKTDAGGVAQLAGLPPDEDLVIEAFKEGSELKGSVLVRLEPGQSAVVDPLEIPEPGSLWLTAGLDDEFLKSFPSASLFAVRLERTKTDEKQPPDTRDLRLQSNKSTVELAELVPGTWGVQLLVRVDGVVQNLDVDPVEIQAGRIEEAERTAKPAIVEGVVLARHQGVEAFIDVRDWPAGPATTSRAFASKSDGSFRLVLPREGTYDIDVRRKVPEDAPGIVLGTRELVPGRRLELVLPANGVVVTTMAGGKPAPNTQILLKRRAYAENGGVSQLTMQGRTNEEGQAFFDAVLDGPWIVEASVSPELPVTQGNLTVDPAVEVTSITLHLDETARLEGSVFTAGGGLARSGAVDCVYVGQDLVVRSARSPILADGTYTMKFAKPAPENLNCGVTTADGAILPFRAKPGTRFDLFLPQDTGMLRISDFGTMVVADRFWLVADDQLFDLTWAARAVGSRWAPLVLSRVPAGRWRLVRAPSPDLLAVVQRRQGIDVLSDLQIASGGSHETSILPPQAP